MFETDAHQLARGPVEEIPDARLIGRAGDHGEALVGIVHAPRHGRLAGQRCLQFRIERFPCVGKRDQADSVVRRDQRLRLAAADNHCALEIETGIREQGAGDAGGARVHLVSAAAIFVDARGNVREATLAADSEWFVVRVLSERAGVECVPIAGIASEGAGAQTTAHLSLVVSNPGGDAVAGFDQPGSFAVVDVDFPDVGP